MLLAVEDTLGRAISEKLLAAHQIVVSQVIGLKGNGYLESKARGLNASAKGLPTFMLTDLDSPASCPANLVRSWLKAPRHDNFLLRVAVVEVEAWLMADRNGFAEFVQIQAGRVPPSPDDIRDPKQLLVNLARKSSNVSIREDLVPSSGSTASVGPAYNARLTEFVANSWSADSASERSPSLIRTIAAIGRFASTTG